MRKIVMIVILVASMVQGVFAQQIINKGHCERRDK